MVRACRTVTRDHGSMRLELFCANAELRSLRIEAPDRPEIGLAFVPQPNEPEKWLKNKRLTSGRRFGSTVQRSPADGGATVDATSVRARGPRRS
jgi:hypothetical protein